MFRFWIRIRKAIFHNPLHSDPLFGLGNFKTAGNASHPHSDASERIITENSCSLCTIIAYCTRKRRKKNPSRLYKRRVSPYGLLKNPNPFATYVAFCKCALLAPENTPRDRCSWIFMKIRLKFRFLWCSIFSFHFFRLFLVWSLRGWSHPCFQHARCIITWMHQIARHRILLSLDDYVRSVCSAFSKVDMFILLKL